MKKTASLFFTALFAAASVSAEPLPPIKDSKPFARYKNRIKTELSQLVFLMERCNIRGLEIKIDGNIYPSALAYPFAKAYLAMNYNGEKAEEWINKHCYRSPFTNEVMLVRIDGSEYEVGRDFLIRELEALRQAEREINSQPKA